MVWKQRYELGVKLIDDQHKELFHRVDAFMNALRSPGEWQQKVALVNEMLEFMKSYVVIHFRDEEAYQEQVGFPDCEAHRRIHAGMVQYVLQASREYEAGGYDERMMQQFGGKLLAWLVNHVAAQDVRIGDFVRAKEDKADA